MEERKRGFYHVHLSGQILQVSHWLKGASILDVLKKRDRLCAAWWGIPGQMTSITTHPF